MRLDPLEGGLRELSIKYSRAQNGAPHGGLDLDVFLLIHDVSNGRIHSSHAYMGQGSITPREHVAFLLMWLEKFLFCASSCGPTTKWQFVAEALELKRQFPLGKILLGYLYQMLNNASAKIAVGSVVGAGGPWWLLQTWLNLVVMKAVNRPSVTEAEFPRLEPIVEDDGEERTHHRCMSYGEYASTPADAGAKLSTELLKDWFCSFYEGFQKDA
uniref:Aminotransferase-like n=1 Tax=Oryza sativa subsp. japonica TaxID=39947 RepID=Q69MK9_ORYSJ|nr:aminotransferase-like [Oryza sativa Japonica Group]